MNENVWIGIDVGGTKTAIVTSANPPTVLGRTEFATLPAKGADRALKLAKEGIRVLLAQQGLEISAIKRIGVSCGGPLDRIQGVIQSPPNLPSWDNVPIKAIMEEEFGAECQVENDANAGAVAEHRFGAGQGTQNMVFLTMGTGLGAGIITDGHLYHGTNDLAGEVGHIRLTRTGPVGHNKAGSAEGWASGGGIAHWAARAVARAAKTKQKTTLTELLQSGKALTARDVGLAAQRGDRIAVEIIQSTGRRLGAVLAILVDLLNPERIVIGGLAMRLGDLLLEPARSVMRREALAPAVASCEIVPAALDERIGDVAALCVALGF
jgi:glucokinase